MARKSTPKKGKSGNGSYTVGFGRPPEHSQFQPGTSGNPKGRPKGSRNIATILHEALVRALLERVTVTKNGKRHRISAFDANVKQVVNKGAGGDLSANKLVFQTIPMLLRALDTGETPIVDAEADRAVLQQLGQRFLAAAKSSKGGSGGDDGEGGPT